MVRLKIFFQALENYTTQRNRILNTVNSQLIRAYNLNVPSLIPNETFGIVRGFVRRIGQEHDPDIIAIGEFEDPSHAPNMEKYEVHSFPYRASNDRRRDMTLFYKNRNHANARSLDNNTFWNCVEYTRDCGGGSNKSWKILFVHTPNANKGQVLPNIAQYFNYRYDAIIGDFNVGGRDAYKGLNIALAEDQPNPGPLQKALLEYVNQHVGVITAQDVKVLENTVRGKLPVYENQIGGKKVRHLLGEHRGFFCTLEK